MEKIIYINSKFILDYMIFLANDKNHTEAVKNLYALKCVSKLVGLDSTIPRSDSNYLFNFHYSPLPDPITTTKSWADICIETAQNIWSKNKPITLFWSGGIDSTCALVALMMTNPNWKDSLRIITSEFAKEQEYPLFYEKFLLNANVKVFNDLEIYESDIYDNDDIIIDGFCGGQLWGTNLSSLKQFDYSKSIYYANQPYNTFYDLIDFNKKDILVEYIESQIKKFPIEIETCADLIWFLTFTHRWESVKYRHMSCVKDEKHFYRMTNFFNTDDFQRWTMTKDNFPLKIGYTTRTFKQPAKDFIYSFTNDEVYKENKTQIQSLQYSFSDKRMINDRYNFLLVSETKYLTKKDDIFEYLKTMINE